MTVASDEGRDAGDGGSATSGEDAPGERRTRRHRTASPLSPLVDRAPPMAALVVAVLAIGTSAVLVRASAAPSLVAAFYRVAVTTALLAPLAVTRDRTALASLGRSDALFAGASGAALALHFAAWFESLEWTTVAASVTLVQAQPLFVALGARALLDERVTRRTAAGIGLALAGMAVMSLLGAEATATAPRPLYGDALALAGAVAAAGYVLAGRSLRQRVPLVPYVTVVYGVCALCLLGLVVWRGRPLLGYPTREWLLFLAMAVGPGVVGHTVVNWTLAHVESSVVSVALLGEPVCAMILALVVLGEVPTAATLVGGAVVLGGIYVAAGSTGGGG